MRMLLSDADRRSAETLREELRVGDPQWQIDAVAGADEALALLETESYDAVVWELATPGAAGLLTLRRLRAQAGAAVLIVVAAPAAEALARRTLAEGADAYLLRHPAWTSRLFAVLAQTESLLRRNRETARLRVELEQARRAHQALLDSFSCPAAVLTAEGQMAAGNQALGPFLGRTPPDLLDRPLAGFLLSAESLDLLLNAALDENAPLPQSGPGLLAAWRDPGEVAAQLMIRHDAGHFLLSTLRLRLLPGLPFSRLLARFDAPAAGPEGGAGEASAAAEALWHAEDLYVLLADDQNHLLRLGRGLRMALGEQGRGSLSVAGLLEPATLSRLNEALCERGRFLGQVRLLLPGGHNRACYLSASALGDPGGDGASLWVGVPLETEAERLPGAGAQAALLRLTEAVAHLPELCGPPELPAELLGAAQRVLGFEAGVMELQLAGESTEPADCWSHRGLTTADALQIRERLHVLLAAGKLSQGPLVIADLADYCRRCGETGLRTALEAEGLSAALWVPVIAAERPLGFFFGAFRSPEPLSPDHHRLYDLLSVGLGRLARAYAVGQRLQQATARQDRLLQVSRRLHEAGDLAQLLPRLGEAVEALFPGVCAWVHLREEGSDLLEETFRRCPEDFVVHNLTPHVQRLAWEVLASGLGQRATPAAAGGAPGWLRAQPLLREGDCRGVLTLGYLGEEPRGLLDEGSLELLAAHLAAGLSLSQRLEDLERGRLHAEASARAAAVDAARSLRTLQAVGAAAVPAEPRERLTRLLALALTEAELSHLQLYLAGPEGGRLSGLVEARPGGVVRDLPPAEADLALPGDLQTEDALGAAPYLVRTLPAAGLASPPRTEVLVPLRAGGALVGLLVAGCAGEGPDLSPLRLHLLLALAGQFALLLEQERRERAMRGAIGVVTAELRRELDLVVAGERELLVRCEAPGAAEALVPLARLREAHQHLQDTAADLSAWSELRARTVVPRLAFVDLPALVRSLLAHWQDAARRRHVDFAVVTAELLPPVQSDPALLERLLDELLDNALKFTPREGQVRLLLRSAPDAVVLEVRDTGPGLPESLRRAVFGDFFRGEPPAQGPPPPGLGLGLALASGWAGLLGATLTLESRLGEGCCFVLSLPCESAGVVAVREGESLVLSENH